MDIVEIVKKQSFFRKLYESAPSHAILFRSVDERMNEVALILTALAINYKTFELFNESSAEYIRVKNGADIDIKVYPKNKEKLLVSDSNEIVSEVYIKPAVHEKKVFIIKNIDVSTEQAQNKLLKVLEEPPKNVYFLLSCTDDNILPTIKSRCQTVTLEKLGEEDFKALCKNPLAGMISEGYVGLYEQYAKMPNLDEVVDTAVKLVTELKNSAQVLKFSSKLSAFKDEIRLIFKIYTLCLEDLIKIKTEKEDLCVLKTYIEALRSVESEFSINAICEINSLISDFMHRRESNVNEQVAVDNLLLKILEVKYICK